MQPLRSGLGDGGRDRQGRVGSDADGFLVGDFFEVVESFGQAPIQHPDLFGNILLLGFLHIQERHKLDLLASLLRLLKNPHKMPLSVGVGQGEKERLGSVRHHSRKRVAHIQRTGGRVLGRQHSGIAFRQLSRREHPVQMPARQTQSVVTIHAIPTGSIPLDDSGSSLDPMAGEFFPKRVIYQAGMLSRLGSGLLQKMALPRGLDGASIGRAEGHLLENQRATGKGLRPVWAKLLPQDRPGAEKPDPLPPPLLEQIIVAGYRCQVVANNPMFSIHSTTIPKKTPNVKDLPKPPKWFILAYNMSLAPTPSEHPHYSVGIPNAMGETETLGDPRATRALLLLMNQHAIVGGAACHWGGPSAMAEMMSSLHAIMFRQPNWSDHYNFVNDAGHTENGIYALRANYGYGDLTVESLWGFRSLASPLTGHGEAHVNPTGVLISNGPLGSGLPQAQGLALAEGTAPSKRITVCTISDGACMEGESKESLAAIPGLSHRGKLGPFLLLISNNNTKLSGRIDGDSFSMEPTFATLSPLGWEVETVPEGNDLPQVHVAIDTALANLRKNPQQPRALIFHTVKGKGVQATEESASGGHGHPLKAGDPRLADFIQEVYHPEQPPQEFLERAETLLAPPPASKSPSAKREKVQAGVSRAAIDAVQKGLPVYSVSSDLQGSTGMGAFHKEFPQYSLDVGVAEANMISTAAGLSKRGIIPIVDTFSQFGVTKGNLPLIMAGLSQAPVIAIFSHTGFQDAADGASHQATTYFSAIASIPHTRIVCCSCSGEAQAHLTTAIENFHQQRARGEIPESVVFFMGGKTSPPTTPTNPGTLGTTFKYWEKRGATSPSPPLARWWKRPSRPVPYSKKTVFPPPSPTSLLSIAPRSPPWPNVWKKPTDASSRWKTTR